MKGLGLRTHEVGFAESVQQTARRINRSGIVIKVRASDFTQPLGRMSAKANEFTKNLDSLLDNPNIIPHHQWDYYDKN